MPLPLAAAALIGTGVEVLGGLFSNKKQIDLSREQMAFQREMASTQYQRSAKDLEKAGLNRILALGSPAASPGGAMASISNPTAGVANSARNVALLNTQKKLLDTQIYQSTAAGLQADAAGVKLLKEATGQDLANKEAEMRLKVYQKYPQLFMLNQFSAPAATGMAGAKSVIEGLGKGITKLMRIK